MKKRSHSSARKRSSKARLKMPPMDNLRVVYTEAEIRKRVQELAGKVNRDYKSKTLHVVGILENCFLFMADLVRALKIPVACHFIKAEIHDTLAGGVAVREI